jgi:hypothetical protein
MFWAENVNSGSSSGSALRTRTRDTLQKEGAMLSMLGFAAGV